MTSSKATAVTEHLAYGIDNPMWDLVKDRVRRDPWLGGLGVGEPHDYDQILRRTDVTSRYAWTITAPETVAFVADHLRGWAIDPLAGSGYWAFLLAQCGVDVAASDLNPPAFDREINKWHREGTHWTVERIDAVEAVSCADLSRSLLLAWPPYDEPIGTKVVSAFRGDRIVYIGENWGGCCGDDDMFTLFEQEWTVAAEHAPIQFWGIHDNVTVYDRAVSS